MKKLIIVLLMIPCFLTAIGQDYENAVKLRQSWLLANPIKQVALQYERGLSDNISAYANVGFILPRNFANDYQVPQWFKDAFGYPEETFTTINFSDRTLTMDNIKFSGWSAGLGARFYPQAEAVKRFYLGLKGSYTNTGFNNMTGTDQFDFNYEGDLKFNFTTFALELGNQFVISDIVSLDWTILSFGTSILKTKGNYTTTDPNRNYIADKTDIDDWFANTLDLPFGSGQTLQTVTTTDNSLDIDIQSFLLPYIRTGVTIGIVF